MKTNKQTLWQNTLNQFYWLLLLWPSYSFTTRLQATRRKLSVAYKVVRIGLNALNKTLIVNRRLYLAIVFMLVVSPIVNISYVFFDETVRDLSWYHVNYYYLFHILSPWLTFLSFTTGVFLLFPEGSKRAYFLLIPVTYATGKIIWLIQVTSNEQLLELVPMYFVVWAFFIAFIWLFSIDYLMARKYHKYDGIICRIAGLIKIKAPYELIDKEIKELQSFQNKY